MRGAAFYIVVVVAGMAVGPVFDHVPRFIEHGFVSAFIAYVAMDLRRIWRERREA